MKKLFLFICYLTIAITVNAQKWQEKTVNGDQTSRTIIYTSINFKSNKGMMMLSDLNDRVSITIYKGKIKFNFINRAESIFKFYDNNKTLIKEKKIPLLKLTEKTGYIYNINDIEEVCNYINNNKGFIIISIPRENKKNLNIKVKCHKQ